MSVYSKMSMQLIEVGDAKTRKDFLQLPVRLYKQDKNWIQPLDVEIESIFDPEKNENFKNGEAIRWILTDGNQVIGRVATFVNKSTANLYDQPTGGIGFFECIDDQEAANALFDASKKWLEERGMEAMDGPINFGERDRWWGLLVDGFYPPNYNMPYHHKYYKALFENYGFQIFFNQYTYHREIKHAGLKDVTFKKAARMLKNPDYQVRHFEKDKMEKYADDFREVYNKGWAQIVGTKALEKEESDKLIQELKPVLDPKLLYFAYYQENPIGIYLMIPDLNQIIKYGKGKFNWKVKLAFLYHKFFKQNRRVVGLVFGVVPRFQGRGIDAAMVELLHRTGRDAYFPYNDLEMNWIGDWNPRMMHMVEQIGGTILKTHSTYRKLFDESKPFKRFPIIE